MHAATGKKAWALSRAEQSRQGGREGRPGRKSTTTIRSRLLHLHVASEVTGDYNDYDDHDDHHQEQPLLHLQLRNEDTNELVIFLPFFFSLRMV